MIRAFLILFGLLFNQVLQAYSFGDDIDAQPPTQDEAFQLSIDIQNQKNLIAHFAISEGNYLYRDKIKFIIDSNQSIQLLPYTLADGKIKDDEIFGPTAVYTEDQTILLPLSRSSAAQDVTITAHYQGCSETFNICYPPNKKSFTLALASIENGALDLTSEAVITPPQTSGLSEQDKIANSLAQDGLFTILMSFLGLGLLLAFTPCVFPMIPILSSIIIGEGDHITTRRAFTLSLIYVLAMSITYTVAGLLTGLLGANLQTLFQNPWIIGSFSLLFVILSLSMFGLYELQLPQSLQDRLHQISHRQKGGKLIGVAMMGLLSGLIVGPCLAPPLAGALIFIGQQGDPILGALALFSLSLGMGLPLLIIGTSAGSLLPRAGSWMDGIKAVFGVLMLGLAVWLLERIIPSATALFLWGTVLIIAAVFLGASQTLPSTASSWQKLLKGLGLALLSYGVLLIIGSASGGGSIWQPINCVLSSGNTPMTMQSRGVQFTEIDSLEDLEQQLKASKQPAMLDLYADWCIDCKTMEMTTFRDPAVVEALRNTTTLKVDMTDNNAAHQALLKRFTLFGPPTILFFDPQGQEYKQFRIVGNMNPTEFIEHLAKIPGIVN